MPIDPSRFHDSFFDEVAEHLERLEGLVFAIEGAAATRADFDALFRVAHSIKGASGTFGFREMAELTHDLESVLNRLREGELRVTRELADAVLATGDVLREQLAAYRAQQAPPDARAQAMRDALQRLLRVDAAPSAAPAAATTEMHQYTIRYRTFRDAAQAERATSAMIATLRELGQCTVTQSAPDGFELEYTGTQSQAEIADLFAFILLDDDELAIESLTPAPVAVEEFGFFDDVDPMPASPPRDVAPVAEAEAQALAFEERRRHDDDSTVRVKLQKIDTLINLVGEMLIAQSSLQDRASRLDPVEYEDLHSSINLLQRHTRDVRESVMSIRMLPIGSIFNRFPRMVRELASQLGKEVTFESSGGETELDKGLIESIVDPLTHIIRNSVDHGLELPNERVVAGKSRQGVVLVRAFQRGGNVVVEVSDDGAGMNRERILAKAEALNMRMKEHMSDREVWALVCAPGFSTAQEVTDVSGRGVGMDVVKRNIHMLGGNVEIDSWAGKGTRIALVLPLTLAVQDGLAVRIGDEICIVPLTSISESIVVSPESVVYPPDATPFILYRGDPLPLAAAPGCQLDLNAHERIVVVVEADGRNAGLLVDGLESEYQVVIKSLEQNFRKVDGYSGATILGNGKVALILDVSAIVAR